MSHAASPRSLLRPMKARDPHEPHRAASPLELLTDLCFVVAVAQSAAEFHHAISANHLTQGIIGFAMSFFGVWWAWLNFTWFASSYDNDDVVYRLLTILQIIGSLVFAAGIPRMVGGDFVLGVTGYIIMRVALVAQWLRAAKHDPERRETCLRYAQGIFMVQLLWIGFLLVPKGFVIPIFFFLAIVEMLVPAFAEVSGKTPWHPHHVAERYGLFFIIVLGETILSSTLAVQSMLNEHRTHLQVLCVVFGGILIIFSAWWLYFARDAGEVLSESQNSDLKAAFKWGFGHYFIFASGAALGAGLAARVDYWTKEEAATALISGATVTVPVALLLAALWTVHVRCHDASARTLVPFLAAIVLVLATTFTPYPEVLSGIICAILVAVEVKLESQSQVAASVV